jgi:hypothetical protein
MKPKREPVLSEAEYEIQNGASSRQACGGSFCMTKMISVMLRSNALFTAVSFAATLLIHASSGSAAERMILKVPDESGQYCHLKFPAITRDSLFTDRPVLKDPSEGDIIDFYGPCDHDPLGKAEVQRQRADYRRQFTRPAD